MEVIIPKVEPEEETTESDLWLKENSTENQGTVYPPGSEERVLLEEAMQFQKTANSITTTVMKMVNRHSELAKRCMALQKKVVDLTNKNQDLLLRELQVRQENSRMKDEMAAAAKVSARDPVKPQANNGSLSNALLIPNKANSVKPGEKKSTVAEAGQSKEGHKDFVVQATYKNGSTKCIFIPASRLLNSANAQKRKSTPDVSPSVLQANPIQAKKAKEDIVPAQCVNKEAAVEKYKIWRASGMTKSELQHRGIPLMRAYVKSNCGKLIFATFPITAVKGALESTNEFPLGLTCADTIGMYQGKILLVKDVLSRRKRTIYPLSSGFRLPAELKGDKWSHKLLEFIKEGSNQYKFIGMHELNKVTDKERVYVHTMTREEYLTRSDKVKVNEMLIIQVYNDDSKQWLVESGAYQFYAAVKDDPYSIAAPMHQMPLPEVHSSRCGCDKNV